MPDNVVQLAGTRPFGEPNPEIIAHLQWMLDQAQSGRLTFLAYVMFGADNVMKTDWVGADEVSGTRAIGAVEVLRTELMQAYLDANTER